jgi:hypothetical protein
MRRPRLARRGRIPASEERSVPKAAQRRGSAFGLLGELGETAFMHKATSLGFGLALPYGHLHRYDFIVESGANLWRVQVKSTTYMVDGSYQVCIRRNTPAKSVAYTACEIDFVAVYIIPEQTWYILPVREVAGRQALRIRPKGHRRVGPYAYYREAWHLMRELDGLSSDRSTAEL